LWVANVRARQKGVRWACGTRAAGALEFDRWAYERSCVRSCGETAASATRRVSAVAVAFGMPTRQQLCCFICCLVTATFGVVVCGGCGCDLGTGPNKEAQTRRLHSCKSCHSGAFECDSRRDERAGGCGGGRGGGCSPPTMRTLTVTMDSASTPCEARVPLSITRPPAHTYRHSDGMPVARADQPSNESEGWEQQEHVSCESTLGWVGARADSRFCRHFSSRQAMRARQGSIQRCPRLAAS
jgi:hypothetical protein